VKSPGRAGDGPAERPQRGLSPGAVAALNYAVAATGHRTEGHIVRLRESGRTTGWSSMSGSEADLRLPQPDPGGAGVRTGPLFGGGSRHP